ncbi:MAG TPA: DUF4385 family protein [Polyangiaceae bacterium]|jgi:hypothetical protein|nr:DUF4385 family protein [Polyangiaceae bacterium]
MTKVTPKGIERALMKLLEARHPRSACPSEVARYIDKEAWRALMPSVRDAAGRLAKRGRVDVLQKGKKVEVNKVRGPIRLRLASAASAYRAVDFRKRPEDYRVGRGEQGVLTAEPYKTELLPLWRFKTEADAKASAKSLHAAFIAYREQHDFVGMDMARKFVQMGFTRARRYANHKGGRKYDERGNVLPFTPDREKARAANVFYRLWKKLESDEEYRAARATWLESERAR